MKISKAMLKVLEVFEGKKHEAYRDTKGIFTIGIGHVILPDEQHLLGARLSDEEIYALKHKDLERFESVLNNHNLPLKQHQHDALISFMFNIGIGAFEKSTLFKYLKSGDIESAGKEFLKWVKPRELLSRRVAEYNIFLSGNFSDEIKIDSRMTKKQVDIMSEYVIIYRNAYNKQ